MKLRMDGTCENENETKMNNTSWTSNKQMKERSALIKLVFKYDYDGEERYILYLIIGIYQ